MVFDDSRSFLRKLEEDGEVDRVEGANWNLEIGTITELVAEKRGHPLLFDKIKDCPQGYKVVTNLLTTKRRFCTAFNLPPDIDKLEIVKRWHGTQIEPIKPVEVDTGPVMQNVHIGDEIDLFEFPVPKYHEHDGGRYMGTGHIVIMRDPDSGYINVGVQRAMLHDQNTLGLYINPGKHNQIISEKYWARGENCQVVMAFSPDPVLFTAAAFYAPWGISEFDWAGWMRNKPIEVIKGNMTGLPFPAHDEIVIEGECLSPKTELRKEGPFGEGTGYYGGFTELEPVVRVKALYHRDNPILSGTPPMKPDSIAIDNCIRTSVVLWDNLESAGVPGIKGVWQLEAGAGHLLTVVSIKQDHIGHAKQVGVAAAAGHGGACTLGKFVIVVDDDIDPTNIDDVFWAVATRCDPETGIDIIRNVLASRLDPLLSPEQRAKKEYSHSIAIIDACKPFIWRHEFPLTNKCSPELRKEVIEKWRSKVPYL